MGGAGGGEWVGIGIGMQNEKILFKIHLIIEIVKNKTLPYKTNLFENLHIGWA